MGTYNQFFEAVRLRESSNNYTVENRLGYLGAYQFSMARLSDFKLTKLRPEVAKSLKNSDYEFVQPFSRDLFLASRTLQDFVFHLHVQDHKNKIKSLFGQKFFQSVYFGVQPDMSGSIGVAHLLGLGGLLDLLKGVDGQDANGTKASEYLLKFRGFEIS